MPAAAAQAFGAVLGFASEEDAARAVDAQSDQSRRSIDQLIEAKEESGIDATALFNQAEQNAQEGIGAALNVFGQTVPEIGGVFQRGNVAAQQVLLSGLPQIQNAILGGNVDLSQLQPQTLDVNFDFANQQLPEFTSIQDTLNNVDDSRFQATLDRANEEGLNNSPFFAGLGNIGGGGGGGGGGGFTFNLGGGFNAPGTGFAPPPIALPGI